MSDYTEQAAIGTGEVSRTEVESEEEPVTVPSILKEIDDVDLNEWDEDDSVEDLLKSEFATNVEEVQGTVLTDGSDAEAVENDQSYTEHAALTEHDPSTVDPDSVALENLQKKSEDGGLDGTTSVDNRGEVVMDAIERATEDVRSKDTTDEELLFREAVSYATEMATSKIEAAELAGDYVLKVSDDTKTAVKARKEAVGGFGKARQYVSSYEEAPDDVNCKEGPNGSLYYDPDERGRGNNEATGPVDNDLLDMDRDELTRAMEVDPNDPDSSLEDARKAAGVDKAVRKVAEAFDVEVGRVERLFKQASERGVTDVQSLLKQAEVVFGKQDHTVEQGNVYYSRTNETEAVVMSVEGDEAEVTTGSDMWREQVEDIQDKVSDGDWVHLPGEDRPMDDVDPSPGKPEEKDNDEGLEDACWDGYEAEGMKPNPNGDGKVPNCVPKSKQVDPDEIEDPDDDGEDELDIEGDPDEIEDPDDDGEEEMDVDPSMDDKLEAAIEAGVNAGLRPDHESRIENEEDPCWENYTMVGRKENGDPRCVPDDEADNYDPDKSADTLEQAIERGMDFSKERRYVSNPDEVPEGYEVQEGSQGGYYYETGGGPTGGLDDEELRDITSDAMHSIAEIDGAQNISGEELEDGYGISMDVAEDADASQVATEVASVDGTQNITGQENEDGSVSISMEVGQPMDDEDNPTQGPGAPDGNEADPNSPDSEEESGGGGDTDLPDTVAEVDDETAEELSQRTQDALDSADVGGMVEEATSGPSPFADNPTAQATEARDEVARQVMADIEDSEDMPRLRGDALEMVQGDVYDAIEEAVDEELGTDISRSVSAEAAIEVGIERAFSED